MGLISKILGGIYGRFRSIYYSTRYDEFRKLYKISDDFIFQGTDIRLYGNGKIVLGKNSYIGTNSTMQSSRGYKIVVGNNCQISHNVRVYTASADPDQNFEIEKTKPNKMGDVIIGNGVWIGVNVFIGPGVSVGNNSVLGANSVVTKDVKANTIVGGVPAKLIRYKNT